MTGGVWRGGWGLIDQNSADLPRVVLAILVRLKVIAFWGFWKRNSFLASHIDRIVKLNIEDHGRSSLLMFKLPTLAFNQVLRSLLKKLLGMDQQLYSLSLQHFIFSYKAALVSLALWLAQNIENFQDRCNQHHNAVCKAVYFYKNFWWYMCFKIYNKIILYYSALSLTSHIV